MRVSVALSAWLPGAQLITAKSSATSVTAAVGLLLTYLYLMTGSLSVVMASYVAIDLGALGARPALAGAWHR